MAILVTGRFVAVVLALASIGLMAVLGTRIQSRFKVHEVGIAAGNPKSSGFLLMQALKTVLAKDHPRIRISVLETAGAEDSVKRLASNGAQLAMGQAEPSLPPAARTVALMFEDTVHVLVRRPAPPPPSTTKAKGNVAAQEEAPVIPQAITGFAGLKGRRIGLAKVGTQFKAFLAVAAQYGLKESDFTFIGGDDPSADRAFLAGEADAVVHVRPLNDTSIAGLVGKGDAIFLPIDAGAALHIKNPAYTVSVIPKGTYMGQTPIPGADVPTISVQRMLLARRDVENDVIFAIAEALTERRQELAAAIPDEFASVRPLVSHITEPKTGMGFNPPMHSGSSAYYQQQESSFVARNADALAIGLAALVLVLLWTAERRRAADLRDKRRVDEYNLRVTELIEETQRAGAVVQMGPLKTKLLRILIEALKDRDGGKLAENHFQSFHAVWRTAMDVAKMRQVAHAASVEPVRPEAAQRPPSHEAMVSRWSLARYLQKP